jgi:hypothetical protein
MAIARVVKTSKAAPGGYSVTTDPIDTTGASLIVLHVVYWGGAFSLSDSKGNTWTQGLGQNTSSFMTEHVIYALAPTVGTNHTFTLGNSRCSITVAAYSGVSAYDGNKNDDGVVSGTTFATGSVTPSQNNCLVIAAAGFGEDGVGPSAGSVSVSGGSLAIIENVNAVSANNQGNTLAEWIQTTATAVDATFTWTTNSRALGTIGVFRADPSPPPSAVIRGSAVFGVKTSVKATRAIAFGLDDATNNHTEAGKFKVFGNVEVTGTTQLTGAVTVPNDSFDNTKLANMAQSTIKGRAAGAGTGDPTDLTATQATAILNNVVGDAGSGGTKGLVPAPAAGDAAAGKFLKADGTFAVPTASSSDSFKTIVVSGQSDVVADSATDTLTLVAGTNVTLTTNAGTDTITIAASGGGSGDSTTTAAQASRPAAANDGDVFFPNNGVSIQRDTGSVWAGWGPIYPLTAPVDGDFAWINQGAAAVTADAARVFLSEAANATLNLRIRKKAAPSTPYTITAAMLVDPLSMDYHQFGLVFRQSSDGKCHVFGPQRNFGISAVWLLNSLKYTSATVFSAAYSQHHFMGLPLLWLRIADDGTNRICSYGVDGQNWFQFHSVGRTDFLTADEVGFYIDVENATFGTGITLISWKQA